MKGRLIFATLLVVVAATWGVAGELRVEKTQDYVQGYTVQDGIALPVIGRTRSGVGLRGRCRGGLRGCRGRCFHVSPATDYGETEKTIDYNQSSYQPRATFKELKKFFEEPEAKEEPVTAKAPEKTDPSASSVKAAPARRALITGPRTTTLVGVLRKEKDALTLEVDVRGKLVAYAVRKETAAEKLLTQHGVDELRAVVVGKVDPENEPGVLELSSVWKATVRK